MNRLQSFIARIFKIEPARDRTVTIIEPHTFRENVLRNKIWYRGDSAELEQYFQKTARWDVEKARFWAAHAQGNVRKMHSGIVGTVVDRYKDIVLADMDSIDFGENQKSLNELWDKLYEKSKLNDVIGEAITGTLAAGDGAFKITADSCSEYPIVEFYDAENVDYVYVHSKLQEIKFYTTYKNGKKDLRLEETYGHGYIKYKLYDDYGKEVPLNQLPETAHLYDLGIEGNIMLAVPLKILVSTKYKNRGKALFEGKTDVLDGLDEVISQWMDAIRMGRIKRYIPDNLIPRDPDTGELMPANPFDNDFIALGDNMGEKANQQVEISQPQISYEAYVNSYINFLDMVLQGIMSPSTLGIDLKKTDNAESQREKEKVKNPITGTRHYGHYGMSLPRVPTIPHLAQGAYVKPNTPQLAMIGDNLHQGEVVAPENKLREMAIEAVRAAGGSGVTREDLETIMNRAVMRIIAALSQMGFYLDGKKLAEAENAVKAEIDRRFNTVDIK